MLSFRLSFLIGLLAFVVCGCGYKFQGASNPWKDAGIQKVYIDIMTNNSMRTGVENLFTSAFVKVFSRGNRVQIVTSKSEADAVVEGVIGSVGASVLSATTVPQITKDPTAAQLSDIAIASEYNASATLTITLTRTRDQKALWNKTFSGNKIYPGNIRFGFPGTTSVLINDSQQQLALAEIANSIASDTYDFMFEAF